MTLRPAVHSCRLVLAHVPDLVRYGSKPRRSPAEFAQVSSRHRSYLAACSYAPHQVFIGNLEPRALWDLERPWWRQPLEPRGSGECGRIVDQNTFYEELAAADKFNLFGLGASDSSSSTLPIHSDGEVVGVMRAAQDDDEALSAAVLLENLTCKVTGSLALQDLLSEARVQPAEIEFVIGCGEEAIGDRYQRGGGNLAKAIAEQAHCRNASGMDIKAFCAAPLHAIALAATYVASETFRWVVVVAGGSLAKLGMKFAGSEASGGPILEDTLAGLAVLVGPEDGNAPVVRLDAVGRHSVACGSDQEAVLEALVSAPLERLGMKMRDVDKYATELHDPEITEPAGSGNVPSRNYRLLGAMSVLKGEGGPESIRSFEREYGMPGFAPTQGHIASAVPWLPHALCELRAGNMESTMLIAKGSLFLGRMTEMADGLSVLLTQG